MTNGKIIWYYGGTILLIVMVGYPETFVLFEFV